MDVSADAIMAIKANTHSFVFARNARFSHRLRFAGVINSLSVASDATAVAFKASTLSQPSLFAVVCTAVDAIRMVEASKHVVVDAIHHRLSKHIVVPPVVCRHW